MVGNCRASVLTDVMRARAKALTASAIGLYPQAAFENLCFLTQLDEVNSPGIESISSEKNNE